MSYQLHPLLTEIDPDIITPLVQRIFAIEDTTIGTRDDPYLLRYRGHLLGFDSDTAYTRLVDSLQPLRFLPLFREENDQHVIHILPAFAELKPANPWINLLLFILTLAAVVFAGMNYVLGGAMPASLSQAWDSFLEGGLPFAVSLLAILGTHEFGHYFAGRFHGVPVTLPYFIPLPLSPLGTMGAFINMKGIPRNRNHLVDIGLAGPFSGLIVAVVVLLIGLSLSTVEPLPISLPAGMGYQLEGNSLLYLFMKFIVFGQALPAPAAYQIPPLLHWIGFFFTGQPFPIGGMDVILSPVAWAGWAGLLVTALNLIPAGQLDGGHIFYALFGKKISRLTQPFIIAALILLGINWSGWWLWAFLVFWMGRTHAEPLDQITPLDDKRRLLGVIGILVFILTFTPVPLSLIIF